MARCTARLGSAEPQLFSNRTHRSTPIVKRILRPVDPRCTNECRPCWPQPTMSAAESMTASSVACFSQSGSAENHPPLRKAPSSGGFSLFHHPIQRPCCSLRPQLSDCRSGRNALRERLTSAERGGILNLLCGYTELVHRKEAQS